VGLAARIFTAAAAGAACVARLAGRASFARPHAGFATTGALRPSPECWNRGPMAQPRVILRKPPRKRRLHRFRVFLALRAARQGPRPHYEVSRAPRPARNFEADRGRAEEPPPSSACPTGGGTPFVGLGRHSGREIGAGVGGAGSKDAAVAAYGGERAPGRTATGRTVTGTRGHAAQAPRRGRHRRERYRLLERAIASGTVPGSRPTSGREAEAGGTVWESRPTAPCQHCSYPIIPHATGATFTGAPMPTLRLRRPERVDRQMDGGARTGRS